MTANNKSKLDRRDFNRLSAAALGGMLGGAALGCGPTKTDVAATGDAPADEAAKGEWHLCRGLNECKGQGKGGKNDCAGAGACSTLEPHACGGHNECKGQGGCHNEVGTNECKGKGGCAIPLMEGAWDGAREKFEAHMKEAGKKVHPAPEVKAEAKPEPEVKPEAEAKPVPEAKPEVEAKPEPEAKPEAKPEAEAEAKPAAEPKE